MNQASLFIGVHKKNTPAKKESSSEESSDEEEKPKSKAGMLNKEFLMYHIFHCQKN